MRARPGIAPLVRMGSDWPRLEPASGRRNELLISESDANANILFDPTGKQLAYTAMSESDKSVEIHMRDLAAGSRPRVVATNINWMSVEGVCFLPKSGAL